MRVSPALLLLLACASALPATAAPAASTVAVEATAGYLGEWQFSARAEPDPAARDRYAGSFKLVHTGICTTGGPEVREGRIAFVAAGDARTLRGEFDFGGATCSFLWRAGAPKPGLLDCNGNRIPFTPRKPE